MKFECMDVKAAEDSATTACYRYEQLEGELSAKEKRWLAQSSNAMVIVGVPTDHKNYQGCSFSTIRTEADEADRILDLSIIMLSHVGTVCEFLVDRASAAKWTKGQYGEAL